MSEASLGELGAASIAIRTDLASFMTSMKVAQAELKKLELAATPAATGINGAFLKAEAGVKSFVGGMGSARAAVGAFIAALAVEKIVGMVKQALEFAQSLKDLSVETGFTTQRLQELQYGGLAFGLTTEKMTAGLLFFTKALGQFLNDQSGPGKKAFEAFGMAAAIASGQVHDEASALDFIAGHMRTLTTEQERAGYAAQLFGRQLGPQLAAMLGLSKEAWDAFAKAARDSGAVLSDEVVGKAAEANVAISKLEMVIGNAGTTMVSDFAPAIQKIADKLNDSLPQITAWIDEWARFLGLGDVSVDQQITDIDAKITALQAKLTTKNPGMLDFLFAPGVKDQITALLIQKENLMRGQGTYGRPQVDPGVKPRAKPDEKTNWHVGDPSGKGTKGEDPAKARKALLEKITAYDTAMATADDRASKEAIAAMDADAVKTAELTGDKEAAFTARIKSAKDAADAELAIVMDENDQQISALVKLNAEYKNLYGTDLPDLQKKLAAITEEMLSRMDAAYEKSQTEIKGVVKDRVDYEGQAALQIRDAYQAALDQTFSGLENFVENGGSAMQALAGIAKQVANDILNAFIKLSIENPIINALLGPNPKTGELLPTMASSGGLFGSLASAIGGKGAGGTKPGPSGTAIDPVHVTMDGLGGLGGGGGGIPGLGGAGNASGPSFWAQLFGGSSPFSVLGGTTGGLASGLAGDIGSAAKGGGGILSFLTGALGFLGLADGGPVSAGDFYKVGEEGEEWFMSDRAGRILNRDQMSAIGSSGGGGDTHVHAHFHGISDAQSIFRSQSQIESMLTRMVTRGQRGT